jgi:hypothetical protein
MTERLAGVAIQRGAQVFSQSPMLGGHKSLRDVVRRSGKEWLTILDVEGFVTSTGRFVDRYEARSVGVASGQLHQRWSKAQRELLSSDVNWDQQKENPQ